MRKLLLLLVLALNGCAIYDSYFMTGFDGNEYQLITQIRVDASRFVKQCGSPSATANAEVKQLIKEVGVLMVLPVVLRWQSFQLNRQNFLLGLFHK